MKAILLFSFSVFILFFVCDLCRFSRFCCPHVKSHMLGARVRQSEVSPIPTVQEKKSISPEKGVDPFPEESTLFFVESKL